MSAFIEAVTATYVNSKMVACTICCNVKNWLRVLLFWCVLSIPQFFRLWEQLFHDLFCIPVGFVYFKARTLLLLVQSILILTNYPYYFYTRQEKSKGGLLFVACIGKIRLHSSVIQKRPHKFSSSKIRWFCYLVHWIK